MAVNIGPKIGIDGEAEYRKQINNIIQQAKTLDSEMRAVAAAFTDSTSAQEKAAATAGILEKQINVQKQRVEELAGMLKKAEDKFGDNSTEALKWKEALNNATADLAKMSRELKALEEAQKEDPLKEWNKSIEEFNKNNSVITQKLKTLDSEMRVLASGFEKNATAQEKAAATAGILEKQINVQKQRVEELAGMLKKAADEFGDNSTEALKWEEALNNATAELNKMERELRDGANATDNMGDSMQESGKKALSFGDIIKANVISDAIIGGINRLADGFRDMAVAAKAAFTDTVKWADDLATLSTQTGLSTDALQEFQYMADLMDVDVDTITGSLAKLTKSMNTARGGSGDAAEGFKALGVEIENADGSLKDNQEVFYAAIDALGEMVNETERDAIAMSIFGKSAQDLNPMIATGASGMAAFAEEARNMGYVMGGEAIDSLLGVSDASARITNAMDAMKRNAAAALVPFVETLAAEAVPRVTEFAQAVAGLATGETDFSEFVEKITDGVRDVAKSIKRSLPDVMKAGGEIVEAVLDGVVEMLPELAGAAVPMVTDLAEGIINALPAIVDAGVTLIGELISGLGKALPELIPAAVDAVLTITEGLIDNIGMLIDAALELILGLSDGLIKALPKLIERLPEIITKLVEGLLNHIDELVTAGIELIIALSVGLVEAIPQLIMAIPRIIKAIIDAFANTDWGEIGRNIIDGIGAGLKKFATSLKDTVKRVADSVVGWAKDLLGISSPSKVFRDEVGKMIPAGITVGIDKSMPAAIRDMQTQFKALGNIPVPAVSAGGATTNYGGVTMHIYGAAGQDVNALADIVMERMQGAVRRKEAVYA